MDKWINGKRDTDELGDVDFSYDPYKYNESKRPMKVTENELKTIVKEAAVKLIKEYGDSPKGQYMLGKLAARQRFRDNDPHKGARTHYYAGFHAPRMIESTSSGLKLEKLVIMMVRKNFPRKLMNQVILR